MSQLNIRYHKNILFLFALISVLIASICFISTYNNFVTENVNKNIVTLFILFVLLIISIFSSLFYVIRILNFVNNKNESLVKKVEEQNLLLAKKNTEANEKNNIDTVLLISKIISHFNKLDSNFKFGEKVLISISKELELIIGIYWEKSSKDLLVEAGTYAIKFEELKEINASEGLIGQAIKNKKPLVIGTIEEEYFETFSGLGKGKPKSLVFVPVIVEDEIQAVLELSFFHEIKESQTEMFEMLAIKIAEQTTNKK